MTPLAFTAGDAAYWGLAIFLVAIGLASAFMLFRLGQTFERLSSFIKGTERDLLPVIVKTGGTVDRVNYQLDKVDTVTDSAVSMADSADTAVRAISTAIATPVEKVSGLAAGITHGFSQFRKSKDFGEAATPAQEAARQREADLHEDLRNAGRTPMETDAPGRRSRARRAQPKPDPWPRPDARAEAGAGTRAAGGRAAGRRVAVGCPSAAPSARLTSHSRRRVRSPDAHDRRAPRGLPLVLRVQGTPALPLVAADPARGGPVDAVHRRRHAADEAVFLGPKAPPAPRVTTVAEGDARRRQARRPRRRRARPPATPRSSRCSATSRSATTSRTRRSTSPGSS